MSRCSGGKEVGKRIGRGWAVVNNNCVGGEGGRDLRRWKIDDTYRGGKSYDGGWVDFLREFTGLLVEFLFPNFCWPICTGQTTDAFLLTSESGIKLVKSVVSDKLSDSIATIRFGRYSILE